MRRAAAALLALSILGGVTVAASAEHVVFTDAPPPPEGKVLVYLYRTPNAAFAVRNAAFYFDGQQFVDLLPKDYTYIYVKPGHHELRQDWPWWPGDFWLTFKRLRKPVDLELGKVYYFRFWTDVDIGGTQMDFTWNLDPVPDDTGKTELQGMDFQAPDPKVADGF